MRGISAANRPAAAALRLTRLSNCGGVAPYRASDEELICARDGFQIEPSPAGWIHSPTEIGAMREEAARGAAGAPR